jgi:hypothetical protein
MIVTVRGRTAGGEDPAGAGPAGAEVAGGADVRVGECAADSVADGVSDPTVQAARHTAAVADNAAENRRRRVGTQARYLAGRSMR